MPDKSTEGERLKDHTGMQAHSVRTIWSYRSRHTDSVRTNRSYRGRHTV